MNQIEILIGSLFESIFINPIFLALFFLIFIIAFIVAMKISFEGSIVILIPTFLFITTVWDIMLPIKILLWLVIGFIIAFMFLRIIRR